MRLWAIRYGSYVAAVSLAVMAAFAVAMLLGDVTLVSGVLVEPPATSARLGQIFGFFVGRGLISWLPGWVVGALLFRTIAQFGWVHAVPWWVVGINGLLAISLALGLLFAMIGGWLGGEAIVLYIAILLTAGFGWHVFTQRWVECPVRQNARLVEEFE